MKKMIFLLLAWQCIQAEPAVVDASKLDLQTVQDSTPPKQLQTKDQLPGQLQSQTQSQAQPVKTIKSAELSNSDIGRPGVDLTWNAINSHGVTVPIDLSNSMLGGISLKPEGDGRPYFKIDNSFKLDTIQPSEYEKLDQDARKAVLYGRLLFLGAYRARTEVQLDPEAIQTSMTKHHDVAIDAAIVSRERASRISHGVLIGGILMVVGYEVFALSMTMHTETNGYSTSSSLSFNSTQASVGGLIALAGLIYGGSQIFSRTNEEEAAYRDMKSYIEADRESK